MPIDVNGVGYGDFTEDKESFFRSFIWIHLQMAHGAMTAWRRKGWRTAGRYYYFDLHAGPGVHAEYGDGSPLIFCDAAQRFASDRCDFKYQALLVDHNIVNRDRLQVELDRRGYWNATARHDDNRVVLQEFANGRYKNAFGLFYLDPTKVDDMPWTDLAECVNQWKRADVLIRIAAASFKRVHHLSSYARLSDCLDGIKKNKKCIMEPSGKFQWTFLYLTNGPPIVWKKRKFYDIDSHDGIAAWDAIVRTNRERRNDNQPGLFDLF